MEGTVVHASKLALVIFWMVGGAAFARDYKIGCADGFCVIVDDTGRITRFSAQDDKIAEGVDQLKIPASDRIRPPLNLACAGASAGAAGVCVVTDADGHVWAAPARAGGSFGQPVARIPVPVPH